MRHVSAEALEALRAGRTVDRRAFDHVDKCLSCRRSLGGPLPAAPAAPVAAKRRAGFLILAGTAALILAFVAVAPLRTFAFGFVEIFEPQQIAFVPMTTNDLRQLSALPDFADFGFSSEILKSRDIEASNPLAAQAAAGYHLRLPTLGGTTSQYAFHITTPSIQQFVFSDARAREAAAQKGVAWQPMPAGIDGSAVRIAFGSAVFATPATSSYAYRNASGVRFSSGPRTHIIRGNVSGNLSGNASRPTDVFVFQMPVPKVGSTGVSMRTIESFLVDRPGVPARLVEAFAALRDPTTSLPIPIPVDKVYAHSVLVDGVWGTGVGDDTGLGATVVWQRGGIIYAVGGMGSASEILAIANSLR